MNYSLPSSRYNKFWLILIAILIVGGAVLLSEKNKTDLTLKNLDTNSNISYTAGLTATSTVAYIENTIDTDSDGLKDWEEVLWGTDVDNKDSDGDGTTDGTEVDTGRNPAQKGPNDKIILAATSTTGSSKPLTTTNTLARGIFSKYMSLRQLGLSSDPESQVEGINEVLRESLQYFTPPIYTENQIKVALTPLDSASVRNYGNAVGGAFKFNTVATRNETVVLKESLDSNKPEILNELNLTIDSYKKMLNALLLIPVPTSLRPNHLTIVNGVATLIYVNENFKKTFTDPVLSLQALGYYEPTVNSLSTALSSLHDLLVSYNIKYTEDEGGSFLIAP